MRNRSAPFTRIPGNNALLAGQDNFAKRTAIQVFKRLFEFIKAVAMLDHRFQSRHIHSADEIFQRPAVPDANPLNDRRFQQQFASGQRNLTSGQHANNRNTPVNGNGAQGMLQVLSPHGFDNMVDAAILRERQGIFSPVTFQPVDDLAGAQFGQRQFFIAPRGDKHLCAVRFAICRANIATPPVPCTSTDCPARN